MFQFILDTLLLFETLLLYVTIHYLLKLAVVYTGLLILRHFQLLQSLKTDQIFLPFITFFISTSWWSSLIVVSFIEFFGYSSYKGIVSTVVLIKPFIVCFD